MSSNETGGTAHTFCTAYFQNGFGPVFAPVLRAFCKCMNARNRRAYSESNWAKWPQQEIHGDSSYMSAYLDSQDSKATGQLSAISALLMHLSQYRQGKMKLQIVGYFCFLEEMIKATEFLSPSSHGYLGRSRVCHCLIGSDFSCWSL